ncbi:sporulation integral membrane protein YtvI [Anaerobacillus sp. MEB173]|uniref:sporulation integral membrane protein YtvI n=1 Tax=Anaerobacillus sp. MEB173 TaxID=3383345 RepID=UPI003F8FF19C
MKNNKLIQIILRALIVLVLSIIGIIAIYYSFRLTYPFLIALALAFLMNPLVNFLVTKAKIPRGISVLISMLFLFGVVGGIITIIIIKVIDGFQYLSFNLPQHIEIFSTMIQSFINQSIIPSWENFLGIFNQLEETQRDTLMENIQQVGLQLGAILGSIGQTIANSLSQFISALPITLTALIFIIIALFFISKDWYKLGGFIRNAIHSDAFLKKLIEVISDLKSKLVGFLVAQVILMSITAITTLIGLLILRVEQPLTLALIMGLLDLLPYLGPGLVLLPWSIYTLISGNYFIGIGLAILYAVTITIRQFIEPKVLSSNLGLNPLATLISLFVGLQLFGFLGLIIGPVSLVIIMSLYHAGVISAIWDYIMGNKKG